MDISKLASGVKKLKTLKDKKSIEKWKNIKKRIILEYK
jgi:hypothetical protein